MTPIQWGLVIAGLAFGFFGLVALAQEILKRRAVARAQKELSMQRSGECSHIWRTVVKPYARQCRRCGVFDFREDANGDFPDGLREWMEDFARGRYSP